MIRLLQVHNVAVTVSANVSSNVGSKLLIFFSLNEKRQNVTSENSRAI